MVLAALALILVLGAQMLGRYARTDAALESVVNQLEPAATATKDLASSINNMDRRLRIYVSGGATGYRQLYRTAVKESAADLARLEELMGADPDYRQLIADATESRQNWLDRVGDPATEAMDGGQQQAAMEIIDSEIANAAFSRMTADTYRLDVFISGDQHAALAQSAREAQKLAWAMGVALVLLLLIPLAMYVMLSRSVLKPIEHLRRQLREVTSDSRHEAVITPTGPPELMDLGRDAEALRRNLVTQLDQAAAATSALEQEGPVVDAIRTELQARNDGIPVGVQVAGVLRPAEGVVAGDFWDRIPLGDGRTAVVVCDVSGHGARAGVVALRIKTGITMGLLAGNDAPTIFHRACDSFSDEPARFATAVILIVDPRSGQLSWVNAGHPQPRVLRAGGRVERLSTTGPMLSWLGGSWSTGHTQLGPGDVALCFTDGVLESRNADGTELGDEGLDSRLVQVSAHTNDPQEVLAQAIGAVRERADDLGRDDVTMIALRLQAPAASQIPSPRR